MLRRGLALLAVALALAGGCGRSRKPEATEGREPEAEAPEGRWASLEKTVQTAEKRASEVRFEGLPTLIRSVKSTLDASAAAPPALRGRLASILDALNVRFRNELEARFAQVKKEIDAKVEIGDYAPAYDRWENFEYSLSGEIQQLEFGKEIAARARAEKVAVERLVHAEQAYLRLVDLAKMHLDTDPARAVAYCEGFPEEFADTRYGEEIQALKEKAYAAYAATKRTAQDVAPEVPFEDVPVQGALTHPPGEGVWSFTEDEVRANNEGSSQAIAEIGSEAWIDYVIEFEAKVEAGDGFWVGARAAEEKLSGQLNYQFQRIPASAGPWRRYRVVVRGERLESFERGAGEEGKEGGGGRGFGGIALRGESPSRFAVAVDPGSRVAFRTFRARVIRAAKEGEEKEEPERKAGEGSEDAGGESR